MEKPLDDPIVAGEYEAWRDEQEQAAVHPDGCFYCHAPYAPEPTIDNRWLCLDCVFAHDEVGNMVFADDYDLGVEFPADVLVNEMHDTEELHERRKSGARL